MDKITELLTAFQYIIPIGAVVRIIDCYIGISTKPEESASNKTKIKNITAFTILSTVLLSVIKLVADYYTF